MGILKIANLKKAYEDRTVVNNISLEIAPAEILAIVGESGSGKTTLLNMISGNIRPDEGKLWLDEKEIDLYFNRLIKELPDIKLVPQDYKLKPEHKIWENIDLSLTKYTKEYRLSRVAELLELCGISHIKDKKPKDVSGGEKQRTAIARAIAEEPQALLLDEPFSNLDSINKQHLRQNLVTLIKHEEIACLFVTHDMIEALLVADRIGVMHKGNILMLGTPKEIFNQKNDTYVSDFVEAAIKPIKDFSKLFLS
ncbi:MAG: ABC transporter ATP-binding protein [Flectobacillus sp.]|uniref:ABC transporter ATP-binding protein n=1 Tax=Flectobacillus sp. TaxID=50419 RepID=UPI003B9C8C42